MWQPLCEHAHGLEGQRPLTLWPTSQVLTQSNGALKMLTLRRIASTAESVQFTFAASSRISELAGPIFVRKPHGHCAHLACY